MHMKLNIRSITFLKSRAAQLIEQINSTRSPVIITQNGEAKAVIQDPQSYERMCNALAMMKLLALSEKEIQRDKFVEQDELFHKLKKRIEKLDPTKK